METILNFSNLFVLHITETADVVFGIGGSQKELTFDQQKNIVLNVLKYMTVSAFVHRVGLFTYGKDSSVTQHLNVITDYLIVKNKLMTLQQPLPGSNIQAALDSIKQMLDPRNGARKEAVKSVVLFVDSEGMLQFSKAKNRVSEILGQGARIVLMYSGKKFGLNLLPADLEKVLLLVDSKDGDKLKFTEEIAGDIITNLKPSNTPSKKIRRENP